MICVECGGVFACEGAARGIFYRRSTVRFRGAGARHYWQHLSSIEAEGIGVVGDNNSSFRCRCDNVSGGVDHAVVVQRCDTERTTLAYGKAHECGFNAYMRGVRGLCRGPAVDFLRVHECS